MALGPTCGSLQDCGQVSAPFLGLSFFISKLERVIPALPDPGLLLASNSITELRLLSNCEYVICLMMIYSIDTSQ